MLMSAMRPLYTATLLCTIQEMLRIQPLALSPDQGLVDPASWAALKCSVQRAVLVASSAGSSASGAELVMSSLNTVLDDLIPLVSKYEALAGGASNSPSHKAGKADRVVGGDVSGARAPAPTKGPKADDGGSVPQDTPCASPKVKPLTGDPGGPVAGWSLMTVPRAGSPAPRLEAPTCLDLDEVAHDSQDLPNPEYIKKLAAARSACWDGVPYERLPQVTRPLTILKGLSRRTLLPQLLPAPPQTAIASGPAGGCALTGRPVAGSFHESWRRHVPRLPPAPCASRSLLGEGLSPDPVLADLLDRALASLDSEHSAEEVSGCDEPSEVASLSRSVSLDEEGPRCEGWSGASSSEGSLSTCLVPNREGILPQDGRAPSGMTVICAGTPVAEDPWDVFA